MKISEFFPDLNENKAAETTKAIDSAIASVDENLSYKDFAIAVAAILKDEYGSQNFNPFMKVLHAELGMEESLNEAEGMITYSVTGITQDPEGGGDAPFGPVDVQIKADTSEDDLYLTIKRAAEDEIADRIYKIKDYSKK